MPQIAELREINGAIWARVPVMDDYGRVQILTDAEITANDQKIEGLLDENERLRTALRDLIDAYIADVNPNDRNETAIEHARQAYQ